MRCLFESYSLQRYNKWKPQECKETCLKIYPKMTLWQEHLEIQNVHLFYFSPCVVHKCYEDITGGQWKMKVLHIPDFKCPLRPAQKTCCENSDFPFIHGWLLWDIFPIWWTSGLQIFHQHIWLSSSSPSGMFCPWVWPMTVASEEDIMTSDCLMYLA